MDSRSLPLGLAASLAASCPAWGSEPAWPQFRGAGAEGLAPDGVSLPESWSPTENVAWRVPVPGVGWSCPVVAGDRVFLTTAVSAGAVEAVKEGLYFGGERPAPSEDHEWRVLCFDLQSGGLLWERTVHRGVPPQGRHLKNSFASETPVTDGGSVFAYFGNVGMFAFDMEGELLWERRWEPVKTRHGWGLAASPVLHRDRLYVVNDNDERSFLAALDKRTGEVVWERERDEASNWSPPFVWENASRTEIVTTGSGKVRSYDLDGNVVWTLGGLSSITVPSPFASGGVLHFGSGYVGDQRRPWFAVKPGATGDITPAEGGGAHPSIAWWDDDSSPYMPTPVVYENRLYVLLDRGMLSCYDAASGALIYDRERLGDSRGFTASPLAGDGRVYCFGERGETVVVEAGDGFKVLQRNELGEMIMATPAIAGGSFIVRTAAHLYRISSGAGSAPSPTPGAP